ncbi:V-type ATP synthase subunit D [Thioalbus denitrificans]|uniref:V/A-type H+-transporting ATPase subunit D n=1 Tax=Thioalbus denitrificans TaxID=547122 RepID=A0A369C1Q5_9GAMM|nr:V-type ATP synthase subunit D [Thioalbus denitrificans]RCX26597.1 V/A-type H+-transporting ATPase subunit D [Thioalbus denitrificans]
MAKRLKIPPTKSALLGLRRQVDFLDQGHRLLERKKELLTRLVYQRLGQYRSLRGEARRALLEAYRWLGVTTLRMNTHDLRQVALGLDPAITVEIIPRRSLGVEYPSVTAEVLPLQPVGLMNTDPSLDETRARLAQAAVLLARLGESETALWRLLEEQRKTQKRVNALKYNIIPRYRETIRYIQSVLEEEERSTLFVIKRLREKKVV